MRNRNLSLGSAAMAATLTIFMLTVLMPGMPAAAQTEQVLHSFNDSGDGAEPAAGVISDASGNLYGTTAYGGGQNAAYCGQGGCGTVFELSPESGGGWAERVLHRFGQKGRDGLVPYSSLIFDAAGNLYGTTLTGGAYDRGTVFELTRKANGVWNETVLYSFQNNGEDGQMPESSLIFDAAGNLYGTTANGGTYSYGTIFELSQNTGGTWSDIILHSFQDNHDGRDGFTPVGALIFDAAGNLYGTTAAGGNSKSCVNFQAPTCGTVFEVARKSGGVWAEKVLYDFDSDTSGANPIGSLIFDADGNLYGTTANGGANNDGTVFELTKATGSWTETTLHQFGSGADDGINPNAGLIFGANGNLYGTTTYGGAGAQGIVFEVAP
jgi:uncharacterized repeat protein (TIGR03803 family)